MTDRCQMELCPYWPGEGCMRGVLPCDEPASWPAGYREILSAEVTAGQPLPGGCYWPQTEAGPGDENTT